MPNEIHDDAKGLLLYAQTDGWIYETLVKPTERLLRQKWDFGIYNQPAAVRAWKHVIDAAAKKYVVEMGVGIPWYDRFSVTDRRTAAAEWADQWFGEEEERRNEENTNG